MYAVPKDFDPAEYLCERTLGDRAQKPLIG